MDLEENIEKLLIRQKRKWKMFGENYKHLSNLEHKTLKWGDNIKVVLQHNPSRIISVSTEIAKDCTHAQEGHKCLLCEENRPEEQEGILFMNKYVILCNPYPILKNHLTIPLHSHVPQLIGRKIVDMVSLAEQLPSYVIFYNGAKCGASIPDHFHFQAGLKTEILTMSENSLRSCLRIEAETVEEAEEHFYYVVDYLKLHQPNEDEPMMNIIAFKENKKNVIHLFPRKAHRPWQYSAKGEKQLLVSPGAIDMAGMFITPRKEDFDKIEKMNIEDIYTQVSMAII